MTKNKDLAELINYVTVDTSAGTQVQLAGSVKQTSVTSAMLKANSTGVLVAATAGTDYLTSVGISNLTATGTPSSTTYLRGDNTWASVSGASGVTLDTVQTITAQKTFQSPSDAPVAAGAELLSTATAATGWTGTAWATGFTHSSGTTVQTLNFTPSTLTVYKVVITCSGYSGSGTCQVNVGSLVTTISGNGTTTIYHYPTATTTNNLTPTTAFVGTIVLSIKVATASVPPVIVSNLASTSLIEFRNARSQGGSNSMYIGYNSGAFGYQAGTNIGIGESSLYNNISGTFNIAIGERALYGGQGGVTQQYNTAIGYYSLTASISAANSVAIGANSMQTITTGSFNVGIGSLVMQNANSTSNNVAIGYYAFANNTSGGNNTAIGFQAGSYISGGVTVAATNTNSIYIGYAAYPLASGQTNQIVIGTSAVGLGSNTTVLGNSSTVDTAIYGNLLLGSTTTGASYKLNVTGQSIVRGNSSGETPTVTNTVATGWATGVTGWTGTYPNWTVAISAGTMTNSTVATVDVLYTVVVTATVTSTPKSMDIIIGGNVLTLNFPVGTSTQYAGAIAIAAGTLSIITNGTFSGTISAFTVGARSNTLSPIISFTSSAGLNPIEIRTDAASAADNIAIGYQAGQTILTANQTVALGSYALSSNQIADGCTAIGYGSQQSNTGGIYNTSLGAIALQSNIQGRENTAIGWSAGTTTKGNYGTFVGSQAGYYINTGDYNTAVGNQAMLGDTITSVTGLHNTSIGAFSLTAITTASYNTVSGSSALQNLVTGDNNIGIGYLAGSLTSGSAANVTNASNSIFIGWSAFPLGNSQTNQIVIGYGSVGLGSNTTVIGNSSTTLALIYGVHIIGGTSANAAAQLQIDSTTKGVLFPRMTTTQKNAIGTPPAGLVIYDTTLNKLCVYTTAWQTITSA